MTDSSNYLAKASGSAVSVAPRQLWKRYAAALAVTLSLLIATVLLKEVEIRGGIAAAETVNLAGRQRMLSQRILFMTREPMPKTATDWRELAALLEDLSEAHRVLTTNPAMPDAVREIYFGRRNRPNLDEMTREFVSTGRALLNGGDSEALRQVLRDIGQYRLLTALEGAVSAYRIEVYQGEGRLQRLQLATLVATFITVVLEMLAIFWPAHQMTKAAFNQLETQRARIQEDAIRLQAALRTSEKLRQEQADFTYSLSHELKSPGNTLSMLLQELQAIREVDQLPEASDLLQMSQATVRRMSQLIEGVLAYTRTIDGDMTYTRVDLDGLMRDVQADLAAALRESGASLTIQPLGEMMGNALHLRMLLQNLLGNAIKFRAKDRALEVSIRAERSTTGTMTTIYVSDNGIGIAPEHRKRVFGLFKRLHTNEDYPGSGIGLTLCAHIADQHRGSIVITDGPLPGQGTTVTVSLHDASPALRQVAQWGITDLRNGDLGS